MKIVESFEKHYSLTLAILFQKNRVDLTEENRKQKPCRQHSTMPLLEYQNQYPKIWIIPKQITCHQKEMIPKNLGIVQKGTRKSRSTLKVPTSPYHDIWKLSPPPPLSVKHYSLMSVFSSPATLVDNQIK